MLINIAFFVVGVALWFGVSRDAHAVEQRVGRRIWGLSNRTWAWIVAITFVGLLPYVVGRIQTSSGPSAPPS